MITITMAVLFGLGAISDPPQTQTRVQSQDVRVVVRCKSEALIRGTSILLRDLATIESSDAALEARVGDIRIGNRPALGYNRVFARVELQRRLVTAGLAPAQIEMSGAREVVAQPLATSVKPADVTQICDPVLRSILDIQDTDIEFQLVTKLSTLRVPPGRFDLAFKAELRGGRVRASSATIDFKIVVDDEVFKTVPVNYRLRHFVPALTTSRVIKKGEFLNAANVTLKRIEVSPGSNMHLTSHSFVDGMVASRDLQNNDTLRLNDVAKPAVVHRNDLVTLVSKRGRIRVTTKAIALQDGAVGDRVMVRSLSTKKPVQAVVHGAGLVEIPN